MSNGRKKHDAARMAPMCCPKENCASELRRRFLICPIFRRLCSQGKSRIDCVHFRPYNINEVEG